MAILPAITIPLPFREAIPQTAALREAVQLLLSLLLLLRAVHPEALRQEAPLRIRATTNMFPPVRLPARAIPALTALLLPAAQTRAAPAAAPIT